jgi:hypothetical protein
LNFIFLKADFDEHDRMAIPNGASHSTIDDELDFSDIEAKCCLLALPVCFFSSPPRLDIVWSLTKASTM